MRVEGGRRVTVKGQPPVPHVVVPSPALPTPKTALSEDDIMHGTKRRNSYYLTNFIPLIFKSLLSGSYFKKTARTQTATLAY